MGLFSKTPEQQEAEDCRRMRLAQLQARIKKYKPSWDKDGVIQYKTEHMAILQRKLGSQVEFIIAYDDLTKEGYRLMAHDEGKESQHEGIAGGLNSYFYFQKMEFVR